MKLKFNYSFSKWSTKSLQTLLPDYEETLDNVYSLYGEGHPEVRMYENWIKEMKAEIAKREIQKNKL
jgi:hypothetical protein